MRNLHLPSIAKSSSCLRVLHVFQPVASSSNLISRPVQFCEIVQSSSPVKVLVRFFRQFHAQPPSTCQQHNQLLSSTFLELAPSLLIKHFPRDIYLHCLSFGWIGQLRNSGLCDLVLPHHCSTTLFNHEQTRAPHTIGGSRRDHNTEGEWIALTKPRKKISDCWW